jgi:glycosyltransferase involved in cell wall biosynthesis
MSYPTDQTTPSKPPVPAPDRLAFYTAGSFSGINPSLLPLLAAAYPELEPAEFDVAVWLRQGRRRQLRTALGVLAESGPRALASRGGFSAALWRSAYLDRRVAAAGRFLAASGRLAFSFQTQSLFDAGTDGVPHFVYTDHTALANSYYPDFQPGEIDLARLARERRLYARARLIFTMSEHVSRSLTEHYDVDPAKVRRVGAGSNLRPVPRRPAAATGKRIAFVGHDWERKGGPQLIAAAARLRERHREARLVIAGCDPGPVPDWVEVIGDLPFDRVAELFAETAVVCMPTRAEPFGLVYVEALTCGVPVVATDLGALPDIVQDGETGFLVGPDDVAGLAAALDALLGNPERARSFGALGASRMSARYTWRRVADSIADQIREALPVTTEPAG